MAEKLDSLKVGDVIVSGNITLTITSMELRADALGSDDLSEWYPVVWYTWHNTKTKETREQSIGMMYLLRDLRKRGII